LIVLGEEAFLFTSQDIQHLFKKIVSRIMADPDPNPNPNPNPGASSPAKPPWSPWTPRPEEDKMPMQTQILRHSHLTAHDFLTLEAQSNTVLLSVITPPPVVRGISVLEARQSALTRVDSMSAVVTSNDAVSIVDLTTLKPQITVSWLDLILFWTLVLIRFLVANQAKTDTAVLPSAANFKLPGTLWAMFLVETDFEISKAFVENQITKVSFRCMMEMPIDSA
jgi:hypothetical protein